MVRQEPEEEPEPIERAEFDAFLEQGIAHFNACEYHAAHEAFERIWVSTQNEEADFYKGLIQASICMHHFSRGNPDGAKKLYSGHRRLLSSFLPTHAGVAVEKFLGAMQRVMRPVLRSRGDAVPEFDREQRPRLERE